MHRSVLTAVRSAALSLLLLQAASMAVAQDATADDAKATTDAAAEAMQEIEEATAAVVRLADAVKGGAPLAEADRAKLEKSLRSLFRGAQEVADAAKAVEGEREDQAEPIDAVDTRTLAQSWVDQMRSLGEGAADRREAAVAELKAALAGSDGATSLAALQAVQQLGDVNYDKEAFRELVLPFVEKGEGPALVAAAYALYNTERKPDDLKLLQDAWSRRSPALDASISHLLFMFGDGVIDGRSEEIVLELLQSEQPAVRRETLRGLWGAEVTDKLADRVVELADDPDSRHDAVYFGLSTFKPKNAAVVDKLIETLEDPDWNNWDRALWGLRYGVPRELQPKVAAALADMYVARSDPKVRQTCRELIRQYAGEDAVGKLPQ
jgi:predicted outer membrane protein